MRGRLVASQVFYLHSRSCCYLAEQTRRFVIQMAEYRFRRLKTCEEEETCFASATDMKANWQLVFLMIGGELDFQKLQRWNWAVSLNIMICIKFSPLEVSLVQMDDLSLNHWLTKFIQDVAKPSKERYPAKET